VRSHSLPFRGVSSLALISSEIISGFQSYFQSSATPLVYRAPGRVNLIGEHTDYNSGFVFPIALDMACYVAIAPAQHHNFRIYSRNVDQEFSVATQNLREAKPNGEWSDYTVGVAHELVQAGFDLPPCDLWIASGVPGGAGLSSSAALEISTAFAFLRSRQMDPLHIALLGQRAESQFVGMPCGIMDQYTAVFGRKGAALQIDCRDLKHEYVRLPEAVSIIAVNSMVKHELGTSAYRDRVAECQEAVTTIENFDRNVGSLRDVTLTFFEEIQEQIPMVPRRRARHVISENQRVLDFAAAARANDLSEMGRLFITSHRSMQYDYEISCEEIDFLVDTAIKLPGVYGSRMTGGGFGGCTVNLVDPGVIPDFQQALTKTYEERFSKTPVFYDCKPAAGAGRL
jgi:galactokinase